MKPNLDITGNPARILVVDDDQDNRELLGVVLGCEGYVVVTAASGKEALAIVAQQPPDLILLDVMMPGMTGYEVAARIKGTHATKDIPIMMVTALDDPASRVRAFNAGAEGFLTKPVDLAELCVGVRSLVRLNYVDGTVDTHDLANGSSKMSGATKAESRHLVQLYESDEFLCETVARFLSADLAQGPQTVAVAVATPAHRDMICQHLEASGYDTAHGRRTGSLALYDAREMLSTFMVGDTPDAKRFRLKIGALFDEIAARGATRVCAFGEMVALLCKDDNVRAAIRLEQLWNELAKERSFSLLCGYAMTDFRDIEPSSLTDVCREHSHVLPRETDSVSAA